jgi:enoyl-CoA hydratase
MIKEITLPESQIHAPAGPDVALKRRGPALWIRLQRIEALNALNQQVLDGIEAGLDRALEEEAVRCVVLTGTGRAFCTGADLALARTLSEDPSQLADFVERAGRVLNRVADHPQPVIAAINGLTIAGGLELALACDLVIASSAAKIADGHATYGLLPGAGSATRLPRRIGLTRALAMLYTGDFATPEALQQAGLVNDIVEPDSLDGAAQALAEKIAQRSPSGLRRMKQVARSTLDLPLDEALEIELANCREHMHSPDAAEGLAAFQEKRQPNFSNHQ